MRRHRLGSLDCVVLDPPGAVERLLVLCHGFGAPGEDLVPIGEHLRRAHPAALQNTQMVFPAAPEEVPGAWGGRCWWQLDADRYFDLIARGALQQVFEDIPSGLSRARRLLAAAVERALVEAGLGYSELVLGGFSQGSMLACDLSLRLEEAPSALVLFSGALIARPEWARRAPTRAGLKVLQTHGTTDSVLPFVVGEALRQLLDEAGLEVDFHAFAGGHTVPAEGMEALVSLLAG